MTSARPHLIHVASALAIALAIAPTAASAQSYYARERITTNRTSTPTPTPTPASPTWTAGAWSAWSSTCSQSAARTRSVECRLQGSLVPDAQCDAGTRPASNEVGTQTSGCGTWDVGEWSGYTSNCSATSMQTRTVVCKSSDGSSLPDASCLEAKPSTTQGPVERYTGCSYRWETGAYGAWSSSCSATATRTRTVQCIRQDGSDTVVDNSICSDRLGPKSATETGQIFTSCTSVVTNGGFENGTAGWSGVTDTYCGNLNYGQPGGYCAGRIFAYGEGSQTVSGLIPGRIHTFAMYGSSFGSSSSVTVTLGSQSQTISYGNSYSLKSVTFTPTNSTEVLKIKTGSTGMRIDGVTLTMTQQ